MGTGFSLLYEWRSNILTVTDCCELIGADDGCCDSEGVGGGSCCDIGETDSECCSFDSSDSTRNKDSS